MCGNLHIAEVISEIASRVLQPHPAIGDSQCSPNDRPRHNISRLHPATPRIQFARSRWLKLTNSIVRCKI